MEAAVGKRQAVDVEARSELRRVRLPAELPVRPGHRRRRAARSRHALSNESRGAASGRSRNEPQPQCQRLAGEELRACLPVRPEQLDLLDPHVAAAPLLQAGAALGRIAVAREQLAVAHDRVVRRPVEVDGAVPQQDRAVAESLDRGRVVGDEHDRAAALLELEDLAEAPALELLVADGEHLVEQQHVGVDVRRDREAKPHVHPRRVRAHRPVDRLLEAGEGDDLVELLAQVGALEPVDRAVEEDVLAARQVGMEAGAELEQRADTSADLDAARGSA